MPPTVNVVLAQRLFVEKAELPSGFLHRIKRLATFHNPEFYKKQRMRLSTWRTLRVIGCFEDHPQHFAIPRGCLGALESLLAEHHARAVCDDQRADGDPLDVSFQGTLTAGQSEAVRAMEAHDIGVFVAPPGSGKTVVAASLIARRRRSTLILVHRKHLLEQWVARLEQFLSVDQGQIGILGGGRRRPTGRIDVAMIQSFLRDGSVDDIVAGYGHVIIDECHHIPAFAFERVVAEVKARYVTRLTATPYRRDGHQPILFMQCGPVRHSISPKNPSSKLPFAHRLIQPETGFGVDDVTAAAGIHSIYAALAQDQRRNDLIVDDVIRALVEGRSPLVLTQRRDHLEYLATRLAGVAPRAVVLSIRWSVAPHALRKG